MTHNQQERSMSDATTRRAEEIRETTGYSWEYCCILAERERDADIRAFGPEGDDA